MAPKKKYFLSRTAKIHPKDGISRLNFPEGFDSYLIRSALVQLGSGLALFDLLGCLRGDVNSANGLTIGIKGSTSVLTCRKRKVLLN